MPVAPRPSLRDHRADAARPRIGAKGATVVTDAETLPWRRRPERETSGFVSPAAQRAARETGVDPAGVVGHGAGGRGTRDDVCAVAAAAASREEIVPFDNIRRRTAAGLLASKRTAAHAGTFLVADYSAIDAVRRTAKLTALPFVARAVIDALREYPMCNATLEDDDALTLHRAVHLGIAVDLDFRGLVVPVVHDADGLRLRALADAIRDVAT